LNRLSMVRDDHDYNIRIFVRDSKSVDCSLVDCSEL
jgi:hypothetical protein